MATIRCSVKSCHYYDEGDYCSADEIYVKNRLRTDVDDDLGKRRDMEAADIGTVDVVRREQERFAQTSSQTCCETFRPKTR
ncbi:MAG: DUF1540 domain-containing protein [Bacillota bacterium]|jgi:hypothetical protein|nr:DUF1540 domain-containing protein [Bacillota bacterium]HOB90661.1 DUF1540 domain-containing protein [Bacillota bacterium]HPZ53494.1 DUF1540 domain-containing protein [Bacillota bacterium]HQD19145.1 DUF1540 domain-containing protein [Bacillota bacterium]